jgi:predicted dehydrogenase
MNQAVHSVDLLLWFMGPAVEVSAYTNTLAHKRIEVEDVAVATVKFANGALGVIEASTATWPGELKRIEVSGDAGSAILREEDLAVWKFAKETKADEAIRQKMSSRTQTGGGAADPKAIGHHGHMLQFQDVLNAIKKGTKPLVDGPEGRKAIELILAIYKSAETGKPVKLPLASDPALKARAKGRKL